MKEYVAETGGRYTYSDDVLNLQELALSLNALFDGCSNFIISGCEVNGAEITPGYVWLNGKVRYFEGCQNASVPFYIYETNRHETVTYANDINKRGRTCYLCSSGTSVPDVNDSVTGKLPSFIQFSEGYAPRLVDQFFGRYAVLLETPFSKQTIKKELVVSGPFTGQKEIISKTALSVAGDNGYILKQIVRTDGNSSTGAYLNGLLINEIVLCTDGSIRFMKAEKEMARMNNEGIITSTYTGDKATIGSLMLKENHLFNRIDATDEGTVKINYYGYQGNGTKYRNLAIYNGKQEAIPLFEVIGKSSLIRTNGFFSIKNAGQGAELINTAYTKGDAKLTNLLTWRDSNGEVIGYAGFDDPQNFNFTVKNHLGDILLLPQGSVNIAGTLKISGIAIGDIYVTQKTFTDTLAKKVDAVKGKQLSTEDFTSNYKKKLDDISSGSLTSGGNGFVKASEVAEALKGKLSVDMNLRDIIDKSTARQNLDVYSKAESGNVFLKISGKLLELVTLSADEINGLTVEEAAALKAQKQAAVRENISAEMKGTGDLKLAKASNLSDVSDKGKARINLGVYSTDEIDQMLSGKLGTDSAYEGITFTSAMRDKLNGITTGNFAYTDAEGKSHAQVDGYAMISNIVKELKKKANILLDGYSTDQKNTIAGNLGIYTKSTADGRFAVVANLFQDYITYLVKSGKTTAQAQQELRNKLNVLSKDEVVKDYVRRDSKLSDLSLGSTEAKRQACQALGAAFASDYQPVLKDTGWLQMSNSGSGTDARRLFIRQIGNHVCIQGVINTAKRDGSNMGGTVAIIPNTVSPPKYSLRCCAADWNDDAKYNRGSSFRIFGGSRNIQIYESGMYNVDVELNFSYFV